MTTVCIILMQNGFIFHFAFWARAPTFASLTVPHWANPPGSAGGGYCHSLLLTPKIPTRDVPGEGDRQLYGLARTAWLPRLTAYCGAPGWPSMRCSLALAAVLTQEAHLSPRRCAGFARRRLAPESLHLQL